MTASTATAATRTAAASRTPRRRGGSSNVPSIRRVSAAVAGLSGHPQIWLGPFSAGPGMGSFPGVGFLGEGRARDPTARASRGPAPQRRSSAARTSPPPTSPTRPRPPRRPAPPRPSPAPRTSPTPEALTPEETVRAWVDARNLALQDGDTGPVRALSSAECRSCDELIKPIEQTYAAGGEFNTTGWSIAGIEQVSSEPISMTAGIDIAGGFTIPEAGAPPVEYAPERASRFALN